MKLGSLSATMDAASRPFGDVMRMTIALTTVMRKTVVSNRYFTAEPDDANGPWFAFCWTVNALSLST